MAPNTAPGRPGTLTPDEERKLRELWAITLKVFGVESLKDAVEHANGANAPHLCASVSERKLQPKKTERRIKRRVDLMYSGGTRARRVLMLIQPLPLEPQHHQILAHYQYQLMTTNLAKLQISRLL